jgi:hypothetical protein
LVVCKQQADQARPWSLFQEPQRGVAQWWLHLCRQFVLVLLPPHEKFKFF